MKITIKDIAKMAGVSVSTVSKIMNNYEDVGEETKKRVLEIMDETGYRPTYSARSLVTQKSNIIGVIYAGKINADFNHAFFIEVINSFKKNIGFLGFDLLFFSNEKFHQNEENYLARCLHYRVDGCIVIAGDEVEESIHELDQSDIPCIGVDIQLSGKYSGYIMTDNEKMGMNVVEHFYLKGYRDIGYLGANVSNNNVSFYREKGLRKAMNNFGLSINEDWFVQGKDFFEQSGYESMMKILNSDRLPRAVFAGSDLMAIGAMRAIQDSGRNVPDDVAIIGCDDIDICNYVSPPLSTVKQDKEKIGKLAAYMLFDLINGQSQSSCNMVEPDLIIRGTCGKGQEAFT